MNRPLWSAFRFDCRLFLALVVAAAFSDVCSAQAWRRASAAVKLWFGMLKPDSLADERTQAIRLKTCRSCPVFVRWMGTCGSPISQYAKQFEPGPCWCFMEAKVKAAAATCFLDDRLGDEAAPLGWNHALKTA